jgi:hypothetical protein
MLALLLTTALAAPADTVWKCEEGYKPPCVAEWDAPRAVPRHPSWWVFDRRINWSKESLWPGERDYQLIIVDCTSRAYAVSMDGGIRTPDMYIPDSKYVRHACN